MTEGIFLSMAHPLGFLRSGRIVCELFRRDWFERDRSEGIERWCWFQGCGDNLSTNLQ
jgi:hypothetical protein